MSIRVALHHRMLHDAHDRRVTPGVQVVRLRPASLILELIDCRAGRWSGGCTLHVSHPRGFSFEDRPVDAPTPQTRRRGRAPARAPVPTREYPLTLDMRHP